MHRHNKIPALLCRYHSVPLDRARKVSDDREHRPLGSRGLYRTPCDAYRSQPESWTCVGRTSGINRELK